MKQVIAMFLTGWLVTLIAWGAEHPTTEAETRLEHARAAYADAEKSLLSSINVIADPQKKTAALRAWKRNKDAWKSLIESEAAFEVAASPAPSTATSSSLIPASTEARYLSMRAARCRELAHWIATNWNRKDVEPAHPLEPSQSSGR